MKTYYEKFLVGTATLVVVLLPVTSGAQFLGEPNLPGVQSNYAAQALPPHYTSGLIPATDNMPPGNQLTNSIATLGKVLFYDPRLSVNDTISCSSCHQQVFNFSDPNQLSQGVAGLTQRNAPSLANARYYLRGFFFWDERAPSLEAQVLMPIQSAVEMGGMDLVTLEVKLQETSFYPNLFQQAFGSPAVTANGISMALAQFVRSMVSYRSKYDQGVANNFSNFTAQEQQGRDLFNGRAGCSNCHITDAQIMDAPHNIGLDPFDTDQGAGGGTFKAPSLRNVQFSAPYMHDGRFFTLNQVVQHYNNGISNNPNLDPLLRGPNGGPQRLGLNGNNRQALVAFLLTLTDGVFLNDPIFSNPF